MPEPIEAYVVVDTNSPQLSTDEYLKYLVDPAQAKGLEMGDAVDVISRDGKTTAEGVLTFDHGQLVVQVHPSSLKSTADVEVVSPALSEGPDAGLHWTKVRGIDPSEYGGSF